MLLPTPTFALASPFLETSAVELCRRSQFALQYLFGKLAYEISLKVPRGELIYKIACSRPALVNSVSNADRVSFSRNSRIQFSKTVF